jgi:acyl-coenzyme A thioesterase PaaI-like protein
MQIPRWIRHLPWVGPARRLAWYPPFRAMSVEVTVLSDDWRHARIVLPLNRFNRNPGGGMFGGAVAALADPIAALACNRVFPGHSLWTRGLVLDFRREGRSDLELRFDFDAQQELQIREELARRGRATPALEFGFYDTQDRLCVQAVNTVAIRPAGYRPTEGRQDE